MPQKRKIAFLFPGQGAQYPGMAKDFFDHYAIARQTFEEADDRLHRKLSAIIFDGRIKPLRNKKQPAGHLYCQRGDLARDTEAFPKSCIAHAQG